MLKMISTTWAPKHNVVIHAVDTNVWIILDAKINMLLDAKAKVASETEVSSLQFILTHLKQQKDLRGGCPI